MLKQLLLAASVLCLGTMAAAAQDFPMEKAKPKYGDRDPVLEWEGGAPFSYPVHGVDVAKWQGDINWPDLARQGIRFAYIKATEGGDVLDDLFAKNWHNAAQAKIPRGAYHFYYWCTSARTQAKWFIRNVPRSRDALPPVLDVEWNHASPTCKSRPPASHVRREMETFMKIVGDHYGVRPIIYTTVDFHEDNLVGAFQRDAFWLRSTKTHPKVTYPGRNWAFWQYTGTGRLSGVNHNIDLNVWVGSHEQFDNFLRSVRR